MTGHRTARKFYQLLQTFITSLSRAVCWLRFIMRLRNVAVPRLRNTKGLMKENENCFFLLEENITSGRCVLQHFGSLLGLRVLRFCVNIVFLFPIYVRSAIEQQLCSTNLKLADE